MLAPYLIDSGIAIDIERISAVHNAYRFDALHQALFFFVNNCPLEIAVFQYFINLLFVNGFVVLLIRQQTMDSSTQGRGVNIARSMLTKTTIAFVTFAKILRIVGFSVRKLLR